MEQELAALVDGTEGGDKTPIDTDEENITTRVKYYADVDDDGDVDGIIFADLAVGDSGEWGNSDGAYSYEAGVKGTPPGYYIKEENHTDEHWDAEPHDVIAPISTDYDRTANYRFYVMKLEDEKGKNKDGADTHAFYWYEAVWNKGISEYNTVTSENFGTGRQNTANMLNKWRQGTGAYGERNNDEADKDLWSIWGDDDETLWNTVVTEEDIKWFLPSKQEWACFGKTFGITNETYETKFGLSAEYWSSSLCAAKESWFAYIGSGDMEKYEMNCSTWVRLCTTF